MEAMSGVVAGVVAAPTASKCKLIADAGLGEYMGSDSNSC